MRITRVQATPVSIPVNRPMVMSHGGSVERFTRTIIEVETDTGLVGYGETSAGVWTTIIAEQFGPAIVGCDPRELETVRRRCLPTHLDYATPIEFVEREAFGGLEIALWDLQGKAAGLPLYRLLGGAVRQRAPFVSYAYVLPAGLEVGEEDVPELLADYARELVAESGAWIFEFKIGANSVECDIATVWAVREALPAGVGLALDANMGLRYEDVRTLLWATRDAGIVGFEEPIPTLEGMNRIGQEFGVPISTHCTDIDALRHYPFIDGVVGSLDTLGGIAEARKLAVVAAALGKRCWLRSDPETGVLWAAMVQAGMAFPELDRPAQALIEIIEDDLIVGERWLVRQGGVRPPELPGLGIELDRQALVHYHQQYLLLGPASDFTPSGSVELEREPVS
jgi:glucarate dehydratase